MKEFKFKIEGKEFNASIEPINDELLEVTINGKNYTVEIEQEEKRSVSTASTQPVASTVNSRKEKPQPKNAPSGKKNTIKAPLPGTIRKIMIKEGQSVQKGDLVMTIEAMKMENNIKAGRNGTITKIHVQPGLNVLQGDILFDLD